MNSTTEETYLAISKDYCEALGGLRWAPNCEAIETADGKTLVFSLQINLILKGAFASPKVPSLDYILWLLNQLTIETSPNPWMERFRSAWTKTKSIRSRTQHFGRLASEICFSLPGPSIVSSVDKVLLALQNRGLSARPFPVELAEKPPLSPGLLAQHLQTILESWTEDTLIHWLKMGSAPIDSGKDIQQKIESIPLRVATILEMARKNHRLVGAMSLVPLIDGALSFPPRKLSPKALNLGGFSEITTKGDPSSLLISQLALDQDEFLRRYVEGELLYFQKEQPHEKSKPDRLILLDQGVRTWGSVRLALSGAVLAILDRERKMPSSCRVATTSHPDPLDPVVDSAKEMIEILESSDLSATPAFCLSTNIIATNAKDPPREIILLTHPLALEVPRVLEAMKDLRAEDRLFTLSVNEDGESELQEKLPSGLKTLSKFRLDLGAAEKVTVKSSANTRNQVSERDHQTWSGHVEPLPFPFRPGILREPQRMGFSADGEWLVMASQENIIEATRVDSIQIEILPRPFFQGCLLREFDAILGVQDGVVLCGSMVVTAEWLTSFNSAGNDPFGATTHISTYSENPGSRLHFAAHYNRFKKEVRLFPFTPYTPLSRWVTFPDLHCLVLVEKNRSIALDLGGSIQDPSMYKPFESERAAQAIQRVKNGKWNTPQIAILGSKDTPHPSPGKPAHLRIQGNSILVEHSPFPFESFEPTQEGKPLLGGQVVEQAHLSSDLLAVSLSKGRERKIVLFQGPKGNILREFGCQSPFRPYCLSMDGSRMAMKTGRSTVSILNTQGAMGELGKAFGARLHNGLLLHLHHDPLRITIGFTGMWHHFRLIDDRLVHNQTTDNTISNQDSQPNQPQSETTYDSFRFSQKRIKSGPLQLVPDRLGQVLLLSSTEGLIAAFLVRRGNAAVWVPPDVFWGDASLIGGPPTAHADSRIGLALREALESANANFLQGGIR